MTRISLNCTTEKPTEGSKLVQIIKTVCTQPQVVFVLGYNAKVIGSLLQKAASVSESKYYTSLIV